MPPFFLHIQNDGNLIIYDQKSSIVFTEFLYL